MKSKFFKWTWKDVDAFVYLIAEGKPVCDCVKAEYEALKKKGVIEGKPGEMATTVVEREGKFYDAVIIMGAEDVNEKLIKAIAKAYRYLKGRKAVNIGFNFENVSKGIKRLSRSLGEIFTMADYVFDDYKSDKKPSPVKNVYFKGFTHDKEQYDTGVVMGECNVFARMLVNMPANDLTPTRLAELAKEEGEKHGIEVMIKNKSEIQKLGMKAYLSVSQASVQEPRLIVMRYKGNPKSKEVLGYVGKGLTYDSGGLSLKPSNGMVTMKCDMGGAAAVIGAICGIARLKLPINVTTVVAACENMLSGSSYKPGDIIGSMSGKTIYVDNTDAEGRLTLADAMTYICQKEKATKVVDVATLTGAAVRALGGNVTASITNNKEFFKDVVAAHDKAHEKIWQMPVFNEYKENIKHDTADLTNSASPGMMAAGLFVGAFVENDIPWVHLDIAGPAFTGKESPLLSKGATGSTVRPLILLAKRELKAAKTAAPKTTKTAAAKKAPAKTAAAKKTTAARKPAARKTTTRRTTKK